jgi:hypothetical protein
VAKDLLVAAVVEVASLSSSLAYEASIAKSPLPIPVACQVVDLQSDPPPPHGRGCTGHHRWVIDPPTVALCLQTIGIGESFKAKVPNLAALEGCLKGAAFVCSRRHARLDMLGWQQSVAKGPSSFRVPVVASLTRWS